MSEVRAIHWPVVNGSMKRDRDVQRKCGRYPARVRDAGRGTWVWDATSGPPAGALGSHSRKAHGNVELSEQFGGVRLWSTGTGRNRPRLPDSDETTGSSYVVLGDGPNHGSRPFRRASCGSRTSIDRRCQARSGTGIFLPGDIIVSEGSVGKDCRIEMKRVAVHVAAM